MGWETSGLALVRRTNRSGSRISSGLNSNASTSMNTPAQAPMPTPSIATATAVKWGRRISLLAAHLRSRSKPCISVAAYRLKPPWTVPSSQHSADPLMNRPPCNISFQRRQIFHSRGIESGGE